jgi:hypothetical protein
LKEAKAVEDKNMREISMDEMDRVSGGSGENPRNKKGCPYCGYKDIINFFTKIVNLNSLTIASFS